jgi:hypothetical protein
LGRGCGGVRLASRACSGWVESRDSQRPEDG